MRPTKLHAQGVLPARFDVAVEALHAGWRSVLVDTLGCLDSGSSLLLVGTADKRHVFTITISPGLECTTSRSFSVPFVFEVAAKERAMAEGDCRLSFAPAAGSHRSTVGELLGTIRWSRSRLGRFCSMGHGMVGVNEAVGYCFQDYLTALRRPANDHR